MDQLLNAGIAGVLKDLVYLLVVALLTFGFPLLKKGGALIESKIPAQYRAFAEAACKDAVVYVEHQFADLKGAEKFSEAVKHVVGVLQEHGIPFSAADVQASIEKAFQDAKLKGLVNQPKPATDPVEYTISLPAQAPADAQK